MTTKHITHLITKKNDSIFIRIIYLKDNYNMTLTND